MPPELSGSALDVLREPLTQLTGDSRVADLRERFGDRMVGQPGSLAAAVVSAVDRIHALARRVAEHETGATEIGVREDAVTIYIDGRPLKCAVRGGRVYADDTDRLAIGELLRARTRMAITLQQILAVAEAPEEYVRDTLPLTGAELPAGVAPADALIAVVALAKALVDLRRSPNSTAKAVAQLLGHSAGEAGA